MAGLTPSDHAAVRKCVADFETRNSKDPNKKIGDYLVIMGQYHLDSKGYGKTATGAAVLAPLAQAFSATVVDAGKHLLNDRNIEEIHLIDSLIHYINKYYSEGVDDLMDLCYAVRKHLA